MKISIGNKISYREIESAYKIISSNAKTDLYLPSTLSSKQMGIYSEIIQLIITWNRLSDGKIYINYDKNTPELNEKLELMFRRYWNFVAASFGYTKGIFLSDNTDIRKNIGGIIRERIDFLNKNESWRKGDTTFVTAVQHSATPYPTAFYLSNGSLKSKSEFIEFSKNILVDIATNRIKKTSTKFIEENKQLIGEVVFELIENTHFWSQDNFKGVNNKSGIRGLVASVSHGNKETLIKNCKDDYPLIEYLHSVLEANSKDENIYIMEISVFDSGSGLASKYLKKDVNEFINYEEIYETIMNCLVKGNTSDDYSGYERGFGLYNIMKLLNGVGFLKIRTNGLKLFRNFIKSPFNDTNPNIEDYKLMDWYKAQSMANPGYKTEGTLFSIFIPLKIN